jgi:hypothetical protein
MTKKHFSLGILVIVLVFGMTVAGCDNGSTANVGSELNGTWVSPYGVKLKLNNGSFDISYDGEPSNGAPYIRGNYTTSGDSITMTITHVHGIAYGGLLEQRWYTVTEYLALFGDDEELDDFSSTGTYSLSGNTLTLIIDGLTVIYTRK